MNIYALLPLRISSSVRESYQWNDCGYLRGAHEFVRLGDRGLRAGILTVIIVVGKEFHSDTRIILDFEFLRVAK